jgi:serine/threonine-protein kinase
MEYFPAQDLGRILKDLGVMPVARVLKIAVQVCEGLHAAHEKGIIHRDIKPPNILVGDDDVTKIVDFGLASVGSSAGSRLTKSGILVGTPEYISPEQITGADVDGRADIYSFGVVMYEMLSGKQPFSGANAVNVLFQHIEGEVEPLSAVNPAVPESVSRLVDGAMAKDPAQRPASALDLLALIRAAA